MANIRVDITADTDDIRYPDGQIVHRGDTVTFHVDGIPVEVDVDFDTPSCFTSSDSLTLNSGNTLTASSPPKTVSSTASPGAYYFYAVIPDQERKKFPNWETKRGELDVEVDPEEEDKKDKKDKRR